MKLFIAGDPTPQGSKRIVPTKAGPRMIETNDAQKRTWREDVRAAVRAHRHETFDTDDVEAMVTWFGEPVELDVTFWLHRPASVSAKRRPYPSVKPDLDKLARGLLDPLVQMGVLTDDATVVDLTVRKRYAAPGEPTGASIEIRAKGAEVAPQ